MRHRASDLGPVFDAAGYGGGFDVEAAESTCPRGFAPIPAPPPEPVRERGRRGRPLAVAGTAAVALVGAALLVTGTTQVVQSNDVTGLAAPLPGPFQVARHEASSPAGALHGQVGTGPTASQATSSPPTTATYPTGSAAAGQPDQGTQLPNTIRLPRGGTAYLVHVQVTNTGSLPIPSGVDQAVWWGTGLTATSGATVFAGHVNWAGVTGPFAELWQDQVGSVITIRDNSGTDWKYRVTQVLTLNKSTLPQQAPSLFSASGPRRVVLATCGGEWVGGALGYADNRVVVALPVT